MRVNDPGRAYRSWRWMRGQLLRRSDARHLRLDAERTTLLASRMLAGLDRELDHIADRVGALVRVVHALREENQSLRTALDQSELDKQAMHDRLDVARTRVEALIERLPPGT